MRHDTRRPGPDAPLASSFGKVRTYLRTFMLLMISVLLLSDVDLPWKVIPLALGITAVVFGIITLVKAVRAKVPALLTVMTAAGLAAAVFFTTGLLAQVALWPYTEKYESCMRDALTEKATQQCTRDYLDGLNRLTQQLERR